MISLGPFRPKNRCDLAARAHLYNGPTDRMAYPLFINMADTRLCNGGSNVDPASLHAPVDSENASGIALSLPGVRNKSGCSIAAHQKNGASCVSLRGRYALFLDKPLTHGHVEC